jgi:hypothetical protein
MADRKAILRGGPLEGRIIDDVPEETENMKIPANRSLTPKSAHYRRAGEQGQYLWFDFVAVYTDQQPMV